MPSLNASIGATSFPLDPNDYDDTLAPLDPARDAILALFKDAINAELGTVWTQTAAGTPLAAAAVVADTWPGLPEPEVVTQRKCAFPCLFFGRDGQGTVEEYSLAADRLSQQWGLHYILSPLDIGDLRKLGDILIGVVKAVVLTIDAGGHPAHQDGRLVLYENGLTTMRMLNYQAGRARFAEEGPVYLAVSMTLETTEISAASEASEAPLTGASFGLGTGNSEGVIDPLVQSMTEAPLQKPIGSSGLR